MSRDRQKSTRRSVLKKLGLAGTAVSLPGVATAASDAGDHVPKGTAKQTVRETIETVGQRDGFSDWRGASVGTPVTYYMKNDGKGPTYLRSAYVFPVVSGDEELGYVTAAARPEWQSVIEFSKADSPNGLLEATRRTAKGLGKSPRDRPLYHGGVKYGLELDDGTAMNVRNKRPAKVGKGLKASDLSTDSDASTTDVTTTSSSSSNLLSAAPAWINGDSGGADTTEIGSGSDTWSDWDGCTPIAGSMVIGYHECTPHDDDDECDAIIDRLHQTMNTSTDGWTDEQDIDNGFDNYSAGDLYSYDGYTHYITDTGLVTSEIDSYRPFVLNMLSGDSPEDSSEKYGDHSVAVVGYEQSGSEMIIHDGWDTQKHHFMWGGWSRCSITTVTPKA